MSFLEVIDLIVYNAFVKITSKRVVPKHIAAWAVVLKNFSSTPQWVGKSTVGHGSNLLDRPNPTYCVTINDSNWLNSRLRWNSGLEPTRFVIALFGCSQILQNFNLRPTVLYDHMNNSDTNTEHGRKLVIIQSVLSQPITHYRKPRIPQRTIYTRQFHHTVWSSISNRVVYRGKVALRLCTGRALADMHNTLRATSASPKLMKFCKLVQDEHLVLRQFSDWKRCSRRQANDRNRGICRRRPQSII